MTKLILPDDLRSRIKALSEEGYNTIEIFDFVYGEAAKYVNSHEQLTRCITAVIHKPGTQKQREKSARGDYKIPEIKHFDGQKHAHIIESLREEMIPTEFEHACEGIAFDILSNYEEFTGIENANHISGFTNPPFDLFGLKNGKPYMIEFKGSLKSFNAPGETKKRRLKEIKAELAEINMALLQVKLRAGEYRIFYDDEMDLFFDGKPMPIGPVVKWLRGQISEKCSGIWKRNLL